jgi:hypothetical protein
MKTFYRTTTAIALALAVGSFAGVVGFSQSAKAAPTVQTALINSDPLYYDWQFEAEVPLASNTTEDYLLSANVIIGLQFDPLFSLCSNASGGSQANCEAKDGSVPGPYTFVTKTSSGKTTYNLDYDLVSAHGNVDFGGTNVAVSGPAPSSDQVNNEFFFTHPLPSAGDTYTFENTATPTFSFTSYGVGLSLASLLPGLDLTLDISPGIIQIGTLNGSGDSSFGNTGLNLPNSGDEEVQSFHQSLSQVPEPSSIAVLGAGLLGLGAFTRRRKQKRPL